MNTTSFKRTQRHRRIRSKAKGTNERLRLSVFRSNQYIYAQIIDDVAGHTLVSASYKEIKNSKDKGVAIAEKVGALIAQKAKEHNISKVVFDRGGFLYHGKIKALAEGARKGGLKF